MKLNAVLEPNSSAELSQRKFIETQIRRVLANTKQASMQTQRTVSQF